MIRLPRPYGDGLPRRHRYSDSYLQAYTSGVFERFDDRARRVIVLAQEEARTLNHNYIGTEHLLLGLVQGDDVAARALESLGVSLEAVRTQVLEIIGEGRAVPTGHIPFTPRAKKVLELSLREALKTGSNYIGTGHLLLGLVREGEGVAAQVLQTLGVDLPKVRQAVIPQLEADPTEMQHVPEGAPPTEEELAEHAATLAQVYDLPPEQVEEARRILKLAPEDAKVRLVLFLRFAKSFDVDAPGLARFLQDAEAEEERG
jgi:ATP-dependent Clp protease ATP-binding subunit ClpA